MSSFTSGKRVSVSVERSELHAEETRSPEEEEKRRAVAGWRRRLLLSPSSPHFPRIEESIEEQSGGKDEGEKGTTFYTEKPS